MDYIFGNVDLYGELVENLKTVSKEHSELAGFNEVRREYDGSVIVDAFVVVKKYNSQEDTEGNCYDWYVIDRHSRYIDYTPKHDSVFASLLGTYTATQAAEQMRRALQLFAVTLPDEKALEVATIYPAYEVGKAYKAGEFFTYEKNEVGDPQLYKVVQNHTSAEEWKPSETPSLYTAIGLDEKGYPVWSQPTGAHDAYNKGDVVDFNGTLYISNIDGNTTVPGNDERWWSIYEES